MNKSLFLRPGAVLMLPVLLLMLLSPAPRGRAAEPAALPLSADFAGTGEFADGREGWALEQGRAAVRESADGVRSLVLEPSAPHTQVSLYFTPEAGRAVTWIDLVARLGASAAEEEFVDAGGSAAALMKVDAEGRLLAWHRTGAQEGEGRWLQTRVRLALDESGKMREPARFTIRQDREAGLWDLYVDGVPAAANLGIIREEQTPEGAPSRFTLMGHAEHETELHSLGVSHTGALFEDADHDGLPDAWQQDLARRGREEDPDADGLSNMEEYLFGTDPAKADSDADGRTDADELSGGTDPLRADDFPARGVTAELWLPAAAAGPRAQLPAGLSEARQSGFFQTVPLAAELTLPHLDYAGFLDGGSALRARGWITAPADGNYTFHVSGDNTAELWLSTDDTPFGRSLIARSPYWTGYREFDAYPSQRSRPVALVKGERYFFEVLQHRAGAKGHFSVAWTVPGAVRRAIVSGIHLQPWTPDARDMNDDGLPDAWQKASGLVQAEFVKSGPEADPDGDHLNNLREFQLGGDPLKADAAGRAGLITREVWHISGRYLFDAPRDPSFPSRPAAVEHLDAFEGPRDAGSDFMARFRGFVKVPESGVYRLHLSGDDQGELWLGTGRDKFTKRLVARHAAATGWHDWTRFASQTSEAIELTAGEVLYIEALHKQGPGDSHLSVGWTRPGAREGAAPEVIGGGHLISWEGQAGDLNDDDLPDAWQAEHGLVPAAGAEDKNLNRFAAHGDFDGDGVSNGRELRDGTGPADPASFTASTGLTREIWQNLDGSFLTGLEHLPQFPAGPDRTAALPDTDYSRLGESYLSRARGFVVPPESGLYRFSIAGEDNAQLWLGTDETPFTRRLIAEVPLASAWRNNEWNSRQRSELIALERGKRYYIEILHKQGRGVDHLAVAWQAPGIGLSIITEEHLLPWEGTETDSDDDGLPDAWEVQAGLDPEDPAGVNGSFGDPDHDLLNNFTEFTRGTSPLEADSSKQRGFALWEVWDGVTGGTVERLTNHPRFPALPDRRVMIEGTEAPQDRGAWYGGRLRGYLVPPVTGPYKLHVSGDDEAVLYVSTGEGKFGRREAARTPFWTEERDYGRYPGQTSAPLVLEAGKHYYFELLHKEEGGRDHASLAWTPPGGKEPELIRGDRLAAFFTDPADLDDDELPDDWERAHGLDPLDSGAVSAMNGPWGDPDGDTLPNLTEWRLGTNPAGADSDGDGMSDDFEHLVTGTNAAVKDDLNPAPAAVTAPKTGTLLSGAAETLYEGLKTLTQTGAVSLPFTLEADGPAWFRLKASIIPQASASPLTLAVRVDGVFLGHLPLVQTPLQSGAVAGRLPRLLKGAHTLEAAWAVPERGKAVYFESLDVFQAPAGTPAPAAEEDAADPVNAITTAVTESLTSPLCLEGTAAWHELVRLENAGEAQVKPLPGRAWYADVALPADGSTLEIKASFENGLKTQSTFAAWKACNVLESGNLLIRAGDALRLTAHPAGEADAAGAVKLSVNGAQTALTSSSDPVEHGFREPGVYSVTAEFTPAEGGGPPVTKTIEVRALRADVPAPVLLMAGQPRTLSLPGLPQEAEATADASLYFVERAAGGGAPPRAFTLSRSAPGEGLIAVRLPQAGAVLASVPVRAVGLLSDVDTRYRHAGRHADGTRMIDMDVFMPGMTAGMRLRVEILAAGVTFEDGTTVKWLTKEDFDANGLSILRFVIAPGVQTSFCHQMTLFDGEETVLGTR